jgi:hypothetical protein
MMNNTPVDGCSSETVSLHWHEQQDTVVVDHKTVIGSESACEIYS